MPYPDGFSSLLFAQKWGRDRIESRELTRDEKIDIAALREAIAIIEKAGADLRAIERYLETEHTPLDTADHLVWEVARLNESIAEIEDRPKIEAERAEWERDE